MIRHVVLWRLRAGAQSRFEEIRAALQAQMGRIPGLLRVEVGRNMRPGRRAVDFALICDFDSRPALEAYHAHPAHHETRAVVDALIEEHWIVDYET
jgi:heme-degrading monooxygenase HmoA